MGLMMVPFVKRASCTKEVWQKPRSACDRLYCLTKHNINAICTVLHTNRFHTSINSPQAETTKKCLMLSGNQKKMLTIFTNHLILWPKHDILTKNTSSKDSFSAPTWTDLHHSSSKCSIFTTYWLQTDRYNNGVNASLPRKSQHSRNMRPLSIIKGLWPFISNHLFLPGLLPQPIAV